MPILKFARDRRGYESTYLLHTGRRRGSGDRPQLLYWFRTPPHVKVGRAAFDEDAIRALETQHPDVEFDWDAILDAKPPAAPEPADSRMTRQPERRYPPRATPQPPTRPRESERPVSARSETPPLAAQTPASLAGTSGEGSTASPPVVVGPVGFIPIADSTPPARRFVRVFDAVIEAGVPDTFDEPQTAEPAPHHASDPSVAEAILGPEHLTVLRARYAEILARISARGGDPARAEALRAQAERVNPDTWVTEAEVRAGLDQLEPILAELHRLAGRRRRRHRRRGDGPKDRAEGVVTQELATSPAADTFEDDGQEGDEEGENGSGDPEEEHEKSE